MSEIVDDEGEIYKTGGNANEKAILEVNWALQEAYKIAVHHSGITDWSTEKPERKNEVEIMQIKIAEMLLSNLETRRYKRKSYSEISRSRLGKKITLTRPPKEEMHCGSCGQKI